MNAISLKSRGFRRSLRFESLENRRLLSADVSGRGAYLIHHDSSDAAQVSGPQVGRDLYASGNGKHIESSLADQVFAGRQVRGNTVLRVAGPFVTPTVSKASLQSVIRHNDPAGTSHSSTHDVNGQSKSTDDTPKLNTTITSGTSSHDDKSGEKTKSTDDTSTGGTATGSNSTSTRDDHGQLDKSSSDTGNKEKQPDTETEIETQS